MKKIIPILLSSLGFFATFTLCCAVGAYCADVVLPFNPEPKQGEIFPVTVLGDEDLLEARIQYGRQEIYLQCDGKRASGWFGFDLSTPPGQKDLTFILVKKNGARKITRSLKVVSGSFPTQNISGVQDSYVNPGKRELDRIKSEAEALKDIWQSSAPDVFWDGNFVLPFDGFSGSGFGRRRIINGEPRNPHTGVDAVALPGTPVKTINNGIVRLTRDLFFSGMSVIIDHGGGVFSMYFHLQDIIVETGNYVRKGQIIGHVGDTGRATGPHLHLGVRIVDQRVNPMDLFR
ncbi:MAG: peptidoglycan DD-metalloendopeptidase family protein [Deltaproteobacteria bacterium]|nr:peptidoglycan DD-metalloendopeptidase family protein [Deltaproteobacteria bacterium]NIS76665.1 peptidoglycan DD-metalloendopeptidase family protein [Deltaproteobacteria bacterium]